MTDIPNKKFQHLENIEENILAGGENAKDAIDELATIAHHLLNAALEASKEIRHATAEFSPLIRQTDSLAKWERLGRLDDAAKSLEYAVKLAGTYKFKEDSKNEN